MSTGYVGIGNIAKALSKGYVGINGVARQIVKAYVGVAGVARLIWSGGITEIIKIRGVQSLPVSKYGGSASSNSNYAIFGGGGSSVVGGTNVTAYDSNLIRTNLTSLSRQALWNAGATVGEKVIFAGGRRTGSDEVDSYDELGVKTPLASLPDKVHSLGGASNENYAIFVGGRIGSGQAKLTERGAAYDNMGVRTLIEYGEPTCEIGGASLPSLAIFAGGAVINDMDGKDYELSTRSVITFDTLLAMGYGQDLTESQQGVCGVGAFWCGDWGGDEPPHMPGNAAFFGGGYYKDTYDGQEASFFPTYIYDENAMRVYTVSGEITDRRFLGGASGCSISNVGCIIQGASFTDVTTEQGFDTHRHYAKATFLNNYAIFAGGKDDDGNSLSSVEVWEGI